MQRISSLSTLYIGNHYLWVREDYNVILKENPRGSYSADSTYCHCSQVFSIGQDLAIPDLNRLGPSDEAGSQCRRYRSMGLSSGRGRWPFRRPARSSARHLKKEREKKKKAEVGSGPWGFECMPRSLRCWQVACRNPPHHSSCIMILFGMQCTLDLAPTIIILKLMSNLESRLTHQPSMLRTIPCLTFASKFRSEFE
jgi:hypothetical protein